LKAILIQTSDNHAYSDMLDVTSRNTKAYCDRHGLAHRTFKGLKRGRWTWHATFNRIYMFKELLDEGYDGWAIYLDADAYIIDFDFPILSYLASRQESAGIVVHSGATASYWDINSGVICFNLQHPVAKRIINDWIRRHEEIFQAPEYCSEQRPFYFGDQRLIQQIFLDNPDWFAAMYLESQTVMNSMHATFIRHHLRAMTPDFEQRLAVIQQAVEAL
jgi:hypothetical protein